MFGYLGSASLIIFLVHSPLQRRVVDVLSLRGLSEAIVVVVSVAVTIAIIVAFD